MIKFQFSFPYKSTKFLLSIFFQISEFFINEFIIKSFSCINSEVIFNPFFAPIIVEIPFTTVEVVKWFSDSFLNLSISNVKSKFPKSAGFLFLVLSTNRSLGQKFAADFSMLTGYFSLSVGNMSSSLNKGNCLIFSDLFIFSFLYNSSIFSSYFSSFSFSILPLNNSSSESVKSTTPFPEIP